MTQLFDTSSLRKTALALVLSAITTLGFTQNWQETQKIVPISRAANNSFGAALSIHQDFALIGAPGEDFGLPGTSPKSSAGTAYFFQKNRNGQWLQSQKVAASDRDALDEFGVAVDLSSRTAIIGAKHVKDDQNGNNILTAAGAAYIFEKDSSGIWSETQKLVASDRAAFDRFGTVVSISGDYALVGGQGDDEDANGNNTLVNTGAAYLFERNAAGTWVEVQKLIASDRDTNDYFGHSVAISGNYALISAPSEDHDSIGQNSLLGSGSAYLFERNGSGKWVEVQKITANNRSSFTGFGTSVSLSGNNAIIGAARDRTDLNGNLSNGQGSAFIFERNSSGSWTQVQKILHPSPHSRDEFGSTVDIWGNRAIVGNFRDDEDENENNFLLDAGAAFVYEKSQSNGQWALSQKIVNSDRAHLNWFATNVSISNGFAMAGAPWESEDSFGFNTLQYAGAAYIFNDQGGILNAKEHSISAKATLYPNPSNGAFSLDLGAISPNIQLRITDVNGRLVRQETYHLRQRIKFNLEEAPGVYFLELSNGSYKNTLRLLLK